MRGLRESDILFERGDYWIARATNGFEVYKNGATHSVRVAIVGYAGGDGMARAKDEIERRIKESK